MPVNEHLGEQVLLFQVESLVVTFACIRDEVINEYVTEGLQQQQGMVYQHLLSGSCHGSRETCMFLSVDFWPLPAFCPLGSKVLDQLPTRASYDRSWWTCSGWPGNPPWGLWWHPRPGPQTGWWMHRRDPTGRKRCVKRVELELNSVWKPGLVFFTVSPEPRPAGRSGGRSPERCLWSGRGLRRWHNTACSETWDGSLEQLAERGDVSVCTRGQEHEYEEQWISVRWTIWRGVASTFTNMSLS